MGYAGGTTPDPTYRKMGDHTETVQIDYDPSAISYEELLAEYWASHRPTRPAPSRQYASIIFVASDAERHAAEASKQALESAVGRLYTDIVPLAHFYLAEEYHQHYYAKKGLLGAACGAAG